jgi:serine/threonine protein kinase
MDLRPLKPSAAFPFLSGPQSPDEIGRLGSYRVLSELGRGGMGVVYRAEDPRLERQVALKVLLPELAADPRAKARFAREARAQAKVEHDHIIPIHAVEETGGVTFIVMPLLKGHTLASALRFNPRPPLAEVIRIGREMAEGLAAAHAVGLIHRDIKPGNVWLEGSKRRVKILDFGLARSTASAPARPDEPDTAIDSLLGTPGYMSPEQARNQLTDHRTDLFSLGVVLYQMATGKMPFAGPNILDVMTAVVSLDPPPLVALAPDAPPALSELIRRLMSKNPTDRPPSAEAVAEELATIARDPAALIVHPVLPGAVPDELDPWAGIDTVNPDAVTVVQGSRPEKSARLPAPAPKWLKPAVAVGAVLVVALAVFAVIEVWPKPPRDPNKGAERPPGAPAPPVRPADPKDKEKPPATPDRLAAEALRAHADLALKLGAHEIVVKKGDRLPTDSFVVTGIELVGSEFPPDFVDRVFLPAAEHLKSLNAVSGWDGLKPELTDTQLVRLAALPPGGTLTELKIAPGPKLTPGVLDALKKFPNLKSVSLSAASADDEQLKRLAELKLTDFLGLTNLGTSGVVTDTGRTALAKLPVRRLTLADSPAAPGFLRLLPDGAKYEEINLWYSPVADDDLRGLARCESVGRLVLRGTKVTDAGLEHLPAVRGLAFVDLTNTGVTKPGVAKLRAARPECRVEWDESASVPKK